MFNLKKIVRRKGKRRSKELRGKKIERLDFLRYAVIGAACLLVVRLFSLQVMQYPFYDALASGQHEIFEQLFPERGDILLKDRFEEKYYPSATNQLLSLVYADPRKVKDPRKAAEQLAPLLEQEVEDLVVRLDKRDDPYEPLIHHASDEFVEQIKELNIPGIGFAPEKARVYPEAGIGGHILGFVGSDEEGNRKGRYGLEGWYNEELAGVPGILRAEKDLSGRWISVTDRTFEPATDGSDIVLTIDRTIQYFACQKIKQAVERHGAASGLVIIANPKTGALLAMCSVPDFDPNHYNEVYDISVFSNPTVAAAWEPGSIMKPITMASAIEADKVHPRTTYIDEGNVEVGPFTIKNSDGKAHGLVDMTYVLDESLNTGAIFVEQQLGKEAFRDYLKRFGFGSSTDIDISGESRGDISSLEKRGDIFAVTASYGQGITVTPIQMLRAYAVLANNGRLMKPYVVSEIHHADGTVEKTQPSVVDQVVSERTATLIGGMLTSVVENGHGKQAAVAGYRVAGKTGTAQIARTDGPGYETNATIGSFVGYAPVDDPRFVMLVRVDRPDGVDFAEATAAPVFGELAQFLLQYYGVPPS